ncbi:MAG: hypothetical protein JNM55_20530 [Anaerolineales bacterium]|nr:hypothetical protein [Anaerolineales bacterium]
MAKAGKKYPLVVYTTMMNRWWPAVFTLGIAVLGYAYGLRWMGEEARKWQIMAGAGALVTVAGLVILTIRKFAYIQLFPTYFRLVTPFLRLNVSYKRVRRTSTTTFGAVFPPSSVSKWRAEIVQPLAKMTAIVIELTGYPVSRTALLFFLSPFFFKDKTPHFVILVENWMQFSSEFESARTGGSAVTDSQIKRKESSSILSKLPKNK